MVSRVNPVLIIVCVIQAIVILHDRYLQLRVTQKPSREVMTVSRSKNVTQLHNLLDQVHPIWRITVPFSKETISLLHQYDKIVVSGPQRSGTTYAAAELARLLNYVHVDEDGEKDLTNSKNESYICKNGCWPDFLRVREKVVVQSPRYTHVLHNLPTLINELTVSNVTDMTNTNSESKLKTHKTSVIVVFMSRNCIDVLRSQNRFGWTCKYGRTGELKKYRTSEALKPYFDYRDPICKIKQDCWLKYQRNILENSTNVATLTLSYESFQEESDNWVNVEDRKGFNPKQTKQNNT